MIPYIEIPALHIAGPIAIQPFGVMVVIGVAVGIWFSRKRNREAGFDDEEFVGSLYWGLVSAFVISHVFEIVFYQPHKLMEQGPLVLFKVWDGLSSMGGFLGALVGWHYYWRVRRKRKEWWAQAEFVVQGLMFGWAFGRTGCTIVHDHPGKHTDFFLGVRYPDGTRHDLGLYEMLFTALVLVPAVLILHRFRPPKGAYVAVVCLLYAPVRFGLDFLRIESGGDPRYFGLLTAGHFGSLALLGIGVWGLVRALRHPDDKVPVAEPAPAPAAKSKGGARRAKARG